MGRVSIALCLALIGGRYRTRGTDLIAIRQLGAEGRRLSPTSLSHSPQAYACQSDITSMSVNWEKLGFTRAGKTALLFMFQRFHWHWLVPWPGAQLFLPPLTYGSSVDRAVPCAHRRPLPHPRH